MQRAREDERSSGGEGAGGVGAGRDVLRAERCSGKPVPLPGEPEHLHCHQFDRSRATRGKPLPSLQLPFIPLYDREKASLRVFSTVYSMQLGHSPGMTGHLSK